jgi:hypothetical protein
MRKWIWEKPKTFFFNGIRKPVDFYKKCVEMQKDHVEK